MQLSLSEQPRRDCREYQIHINEDQNLQGESKELMRELLGATKIELIEEELIIV